jgi:hypothetical protein
MVTQITEFITKELFRKALNMITIEEKHQQETNKFTLKMPRTDLAYILEV